MDGTSNKIEILNIHGESESLRRVIIQLVKALPREASIEARDHELRFPEISSTLASEPKVA